MKEITAMREKKSLFILDRWIRPKVSSKLIQEHRQDPFGKHSPELDIVLNFLRRRPLKEKPMYVVVRVATDVYVIGEVSDVRGQPVRFVGGRTFPSEEEVEHAVFLRQLGDYEVGPLNEQAE